MPALTRGGLSAALALPLLMATGASIGAEAAADETEALLHRAREALVAEQLEQAATYARQATDSDPECAPCWSTLGLALARSRSHQEAQAALERAYRLGLTDAPLRLAFGSVLWENGETERAEEMLRPLATGTDRAADLALHELGRLLIWAGRYDEATELLEELIERRPETLAARLDLARALEGLPDGVETRRRAVEQYRIYLDGAPEDAGAVYSLAAALRRDGQTAEAGQWLERYRELRTEERERLRTVGQRDAAIAQARRLLAEERAAEAIERLEGLPPDSEVLGWLARAQKAGGDARLALETLGRAVASDPSRADLRRLLRDWSLEADAHRPADPGGAP